MSDKLPITAVMITHRSDQKAYQAARSLEFASELQLIDFSGNFDPSKIATQVVYHSRSGSIEDFSIIRNESLKLCNFDWVLWLDSDEVLSQKSQYQLKIEWKKQHHHSAGFSFIRQDIFQGKRLSWGEVRQVETVRLFDKTKTRFVGQVHETPQVDGLINQTGIIIEHFAHSSISSFIQKVAEYSAVAGIEANHKGEKFSALKLLVFPLGKFMYNLIIQAAFLDGWRGITYSLIMSIHSLGVRIKLYELETT